MEIENDFGAGDSGNKCGKNEKIRHIVYMNYFITFFQMKQGQLDESHQEKAGIFPEITDFA